MQTLSNKGSGETGHMPSLTRAFVARSYYKYQVDMGKHSGSVVECLIRDQRAVGSSHTGVSVVSLSETH